jgi:hypothetical protein
MDAAFAELSERSAHIGREELQRRARALSRAHRAGRQLVQATASLASGSARLRDAQEELQSELAALRELVALTEEEPVGADVPGPSPSEQAAAASDAVSDAAPDSVAAPGSAAQLPIASAVRSAEPAEAAVEDGIRILDLGSLSSSGPAIGERDSSMDLDTSRADRSAGDGVR